MSSYFKKKTEREPLANRSLGIASLKRTLPPAPSPEQESVALQKAEDMGFVSRERSIPPARPLPVPASHTVPPESHRKVTRRARAVPQGKPLFISGPASVLDEFAALADSLAQAKDERVSYWKTLKHLMDNQRL